MEVYDAIATFISKIGFPVFVATFLLLRVDKSIRDILITQRELIIVVRILAGLHDDEGEEAEAEEDIADDEEKTE